MNFYEEMIDLLPYHLQGGENVNKIFKVLGKQLEDVEKAFTQIQLIYDVVNAHDGILDQAGKVVGEYRRGESDDLFKDRILTKIVRITTSGNIETINNLGRTLLGDNFIKVFERWNYSPAKEPASMTLVYNYTDVTRSPLDLMKSAVAGGINLDTKLQIYQPMMGFFKPGVTNLHQQAVLIEPK